MLNIADIVISLNGRDAGKRFVVIDTQEPYSLIADGKGRRFEKPKKKKNKHLKFEDKATGAVAEKLLTERKISNSELRRMLAEYAQSSAEQSNTDQSKTDKKEEISSKGGAPKCQKTI